MEVETHRLELCTESVSCLLNYRHDPLTVSRDVSLQALYRPLIILLTLDALISPPAGMHNVESY